MTCALHNRQTAVRCLGGLLVSGKNANTYDFELYCRLFDAYKGINTDSDLAGLENPRLLVQRLGLEITQGEVIALEVIPGICIEVEQPDCELIRINGRVATNLLSKHVLHPSVFALFWQPTSTLQSAEF